MSADKTRKTNKRRTDYIAAIVATHGGTKDTYTRKELREVSDSHGWKWIPNWITHDKARRVARGTFSIPEAMVNAEETPSVTENTENSVAMAADAAPELVGA
tara:strand:- start:23 stop:328 length:306 start_codon:yes stop_codon:yes gene_type:complete